MQLQRLTRLQLRYCAKVGLAAGLGFLLTQGDVNHYAIYSSFTAALVVGSNVGEDLATSANRVKGTLAGVVAALVASLLFGPNAISVGLAVALTAVLALAGGWGIPVARIGVTVCIITLVVYDAQALHYDLLRVGNTAVGVVVGLAVSFFVWPVRGHEELSNSVTKVLAASRTLLDALETGATNVRPLQGKLHDALAAAVKASRDAHREKRAVGREVTQEDDAIVAVRLGVDVLSCSLGEPAADSRSALRQRMDTLTATSRSHAEDR